MDQIRSDYVSPRSNADPQNAALQIPTRNPEPDQLFNSTRKAPAMQSEAEAVNCETGSCALLILDNAELDPSVVLPMDEATIDLVVADRGTQGLEGNILASIPAELTVTRIERRILEKLRQDLFTFFSRRNACNELKNDKEKELQVPKESTNHCSNQ